MENKSFNCEIKMISVEQIVPNTWNPNVMDDATFNRLAAEIEEVGFIDPIQVVPIENGKYMIIGGEHRWRVAKVLGIKEIPCVVLTDTKFQSQELQKFITVRLNILHGKLDPEKFVNLYKEMAEKYGDEELRNLMAFTDESAWNKLVKGVRDALVDSGLSQELIEKFDETSKEIKTIDNLSMILNQLFLQYGEDLKYNFMVFVYGRKEHLYISCTSDVYNMVSAILDKVRAEQVDINDVFRILFREWENKIDFSRLNKVQNNNVYRDNQEENNNRGDL